MLVMMAVFLGLVFRKIARGGDLYGIDNRKRGKYLEVAWCQIAIVDPMSVLWIFKLCVMRWFDVVFF